MIIRPSLFAALFALGAVSWTVADSAGCNTGKVVFCYLAQWSIYRSSEGKFDMSYFDSNLCTHLVLSFLGMNETSYKIMSLDEWADFKYKNVGLIKKITDQKRINRKLKVLVSMGGWDQGSVRFSNMVSSSGRRRTFILSVKNFLREHNLDGIDIAWQVPVGRGGKPEDRNKFVLLLQELSEVLKVEKKLVTVFILAGMTPPEIDKYYDTKGMANFVDYMIMDCSRFHGSWENKTGISAPMYSDDHKNVVDVINSLLSKGVASRKVLLQLPTYGMFYQMDVEPTRGKFFGVSAHHILKGPWTKEKGFLGYNEVCWELTKGKEKDKWTTHWHEKSLTSFAVNGKKLISYEDPRSILEKVKFIQKKCLGGASVYSIDTDDFKGHCGGERLPLLRLAWGNVTTTVTTTVNITNVNIISITVNNFDF